MDTAKEIAFGSIAGMAAKVVEHPFDLAKVRLQSQVLDRSARFGGPLDCLVQTGQREGVRGLYRGLPVPLFGAMAETAALFVAYTQLQSLIQGTSSRQLTLPELGLAAAGAGFLAGFIITPLELVKCRMQVQMLAAPPRTPNFKSTPPSIPATAFINNLSRASVLHKSAPVRRKLPGPLAIIANIVRTSGFRGLWVGYVGTTICETGGTAAWFTSKELFASLLRARCTQSQPTPLGQPTELLPWESALSGALAGGICVLLLYPADTVKSAIQTAEELRPQARHRTNNAGGFWQTALAMYRAQGWRGLYAGCGMTVARAIPGSAIVFAVYDGLNQRYG